MISDLLKIEKGITAVIGGGGKTTLLHTLADELKSKGTVVITTTTHIYKSDRFVNVITDKNNDNLSYIGELVNRHRCICVGALCDDGKLKMPDVSFLQLQSICDYILVEADGSKGLPLKAHLDHEPLIPSDANATILLVGVDAVGHKLCDVTHRADKACELLSCETDTIVTPEMVARLIDTEHLHDKVVINKCDGTKSVHNAEQISKNTDKECIISSLLKGEWYVSSN